MAEDIDVAEEAAKANALAGANVGAEHGDLQHTTVTEMLQDYKTKTVRLKNGRVFVVESFIEGNLFLNLKSPLVQEFLEEERREDAEPIEDLYFTRVPSAVTDAVHQMVAAHVTSVPISLRPQSQCPEGVISIDRFTIDEIRELFQEMCMLSGVFT